MIDPRREAVLITNQGTGQFGDRTRDVARYQTQTVGGKIDIVFNDSSRMFPYGSERVRILRNSERVSLPLGAKVEVGGFIWADATEVWAFTGPDGAWWRIFYSRAADLAQRGDNALSTRYWVSAVQAQAFAALVTWTPVSEPLSRQNRCTSSKVRFTTAAGFALTVPASPKSGELATWHFSARTWPRRH